MEAWGAPRRRTIAAVADLAAKLEEIIETVESARAMPLSSSCVVNRTELLDALAELRELLPQEIRDARQLIGEREDVLAGGRLEAERILADARAERGRLVSADSVAMEAQAQAATLVADAHRTAADLRREADDYVDGKLATFEIVLHKTLGSVERGRDKLRGRSDLDDLAGPEPDVVTRATSARAEHEPPGDAP